MTMPKDKVAIKTIKSAKGDCAYHVYAFDGPKHWAIFVAADEKHAHRLAAEPRKCTTWTIE